MARRIDWLLVLTLLLLSPISAQVLDLPVFEPLPIQTLRAAETARYPAVYSRQH